MTSNNIYYVYAYLRNKDSDTAKAGTPYYIGKGCGKRAFNPHRGCSAHPPKDKSRIVFLETNMTEIGAYALERRMIRWWGMTIDGTGILHNKVTGGELFDSYSASITNKRKITRICPDTGNKVRMSTDDPRNKDPRWKTTQSGLATVYDKFGKKHRVSSNDPRIKSGEFVGRTKGMSVVRDDAGNKFIVDSNDPRIKSGELYGLSKGKLTARCVKSNKCFSIDVNDPRLSTGELVPCKKGISNTTNKTKPFYLVDTIGICQYRFISINDFLRRHKDLGLPCSPVIRAIYKNIPSVECHKKEYRKYNGWTVRYDTETT